MRSRAFVIVSCVVLVIACSQRTPAKEYPLHGQVIAIRPSEQELVVKHDDIEGFMPAMTMPYRVKDRRVLEGLAPGDVVDATLVVQEGDAWLSRVMRTGHREPVPADAATPRRIELPLEPGQPLPDASFVDETGERWQVVSMRGHPWALTFVYTRCPLPTFCPTLDQRFQAVQRVIAHDSALRGVRLVSISIDPAFDRPPVLRAHARRVEADRTIWRFVTGETETVDRFGERFGLTIVRGSGRPEDFVHSLKTAVVGADGRLRRIYSGTEWTSDDLVGALREAAR